MKNLCVFCGSNPGRRPIFADAARRLADELLRRDVGLVYGGGGVGLMGIIADCMLEGGGRVTGIIPRGLLDREVGHAAVETLEVVDTMHERKARMAELSDAFVAMPGGIGTFEELFEALTWTQLGIHDKPVGLLDVDGYYAPLTAFLDGVVDEGFIRPIWRQSLVSSPDPGDLLQALENFELPSRATWRSDTTPPS